MEGEMTEVGWGRRPSQPAAPHRITGVTAPLRVGKLRHFRGSHTPHQPPFPVFNRWFTTEPAAGAPTGKRVAAGKP